MITPNIFRFFERSRSGVQSCETRVLKLSFSDQHAAPNFRWRWRHNFFSWRQIFLKFFLELLYWVLKPNTEFRQTPLSTFPDIAARNFRLHDEIWKVGQNSYHLKALFTASSMMLAISSFSWFWADKKEKETPKLTLIEWQYDGGWVLSHFVLPNYNSLEPNFVNIMIEDETWYKEIVHFISLWRPDISHCAHRVERPRTHRRDEVRASCSISSDLPI